MVVCDVHFLACYKHGYVRHHILQMRPAMRDELYKKNIMQLAEYPRFVEVLESNPQLSAQCVMYLVQHHKQSHGRCDGRPPVVIPDDTPADHAPATGAEILEAAFPDVILESG